MATTGITDSLYKGISQSVGLNQFQKDSLKGLEPADAARMEAQFKLQNYQEMVSFISNVMKKRNEIAMAIIGNLR